MPIVLEESTFGILLGPIRHPAPAESGRRNRVWHDFSVVAEEPNRTGDRL